MNRKHSKKVLVTGGAGFIGSNFIRHLYEKYPDYRIYNFDLLTYAGNPDNLKDIAAAESQKPLSRRRYFFIQGDVCDAHLVSKIFQKHKFDCVLHFAAESHVDRSIMDDKFFIRTNLLGTHNLIGLVRRHAVPRFVYVSTDEVYGDVATGTSREHSPMRPSNPYAASKAAADLLVQSYTRTHGLPLLIVRGSNNFGPYQYPEKLIPLAITNIVEGASVPVHGDGKQVRKWIHVSDFCSGIDLVMHKGHDGAVYNISGLEMSNLDILGAICRVLGKRSADCIRFIKDRPGGDRRYAVDSSKIKAELGWKLKLPVRSSLASVVRWYLDNEKWWRAVKKKKEFDTYYQKQLKSQY